MPSRVGPRHAGQSVGETARGDAEHSEYPIVTQAQPMIAKIILFFIRLRTGTSLTNAGKKASNSTKQFQGWLARHRLMKNCDFILHQLHLREGEEKGKSRFGALVGIHAVDQ